MSADPNWDLATPKHVHKVTESHRFQRESQLLVLWGENAELRPSARDKKLHFSRRMEVSDLSACVQTKTPSKTSGMAKSTFKTRNLDCVSGRAHFLFSPSHSDYPNKDALRFSFYFIIFKRCHVLCSWLFAVVITDD